MFPRSVHQSACNLIHFHKRLGPFPPGITFIDRKLSSPLPTSAFWLPQHHGGCCCRATTENLLNLDLAFKNNVIRFINVWYLAGADGNRTGSISNNEAEGGQGYKNRDRNQSEWFTSLQNQRGRQSGMLLTRWTQMVMWHSVKDDGCVQIHHHLRKKRQLHMKTNI